MTALPIVLIHGFPFDGLMWGPLAELLRKKGRTVLTPDLPGFGEAAGREGVTIEDFADEIHTLIQEHGGRAVVGGLSMGGYVLLALLRKHRESVASAMLLDTRAEADSAEARQGRMNSVEDIANNGPAKLIETLLGRLLGKNAPPELKQRTRNMMERQPAESIRAAQRAMAARRDQTDLLPTLKLPTLVVVGAEDAITPPSVALAMQSQIPRAMLVQIANAGHMSPLEEPAAVAGAIEAFLATAAMRK